MDITKLIDDLAELFETSELEIAKIGAEACRICRDKIPVGQDNHEFLDTHIEIKKIMEDENALPISETIKEVMDNIDWHHSGYQDGRISAEVAVRMQTSELIGPNGMIEYDKCRVGLFAQTANTDYNMRNHAAEELFIQIAGEAEWVKENGEYQTKKAGEWMHHKSFEYHASRTGEQSIITAWIWTGDIAYEKYSYKDAKLGD